MLIMVYHYNGFVCSNGEYAVDAFYDVQCAKGFFIMIVCNRNISLSRSQCMATGYGDVPRYGSAKGGDSAMMGLLLRF